MKAIADGDAAQGIKGMDLIQTGQLTREEIEKAVADPDHKLLLAKPKVGLPEAKVGLKKKGPRYTPVSRRQDRPNAILWLLRNHPELKDAQIMGLVGTTKSTIAGIRDRTHWNAAALSPLDPVTLGLCTQIDLDFEVQRASKEKPAPVESGVTLLPAAVTTAPQEPRSRKARRPPRPRKISTPRRCLPSSSSSAAASPRTRTTSKARSVYKNVGIERQGSALPFLFGSVGTFPEASSHCGVLSRLSVSRRISALILKTFRGLVPPATAASASG